MLVILVCIIGGSLCLLHIFTIHMEGVWLDWPSWVRLVVSDIHINCVLLFVLCYLLLFFMAAVPAEADACPAGGEQGPEAEP